MLNHRAAALGSLGSCCGATRGRNRSNTRPPSAPSSIAIPYYPTTRHQQRRRPQTALQSQAGPRLERSSEPQPSFSTNDTRAPARHPRAFFITARRRRRVRCHCHTCHIHQSRRSSPCTCDTITTAVHETHRSNFVHQILTFRVKVGNHGLDIHSDKRRRRRRRRRARVLLLARMAARRRRGRRRQQQCRAPISRSSALWRVGGTAAIRGDSLTLCGQRRADTCRRRCQCRCVRLWRRRERQERRGDGTGRAEGTTAACAGHADEVGRAALQEQLELQRQARRAAAAATAVPAVPAGSDRSGVRVRVRQRK